MLHHAPISDDSDTLQAALDLSAHLKAKAWEYRAQVPDNFGPTRSRPLDVTDLIKDERYAPLRNRLAALSGVTTHDRFRPSYDADGVLLDRTQRQLVLTPINPAAPEPAEVGVDLDESVRDSRRAAYKLQAVAAKLAPYQRVALCHRLPVGAATVDVRVNAEGKGFLGGIQTCGSVWHCPVCAKKITEARRADLQVLAETVRRVDGQVLMMTLTARHGRETLEAGGLRGLLQGIKSAYRLMVSGKRALSRLLAKWGYLGTVRALEVTVGGNGWHPHLHVLIAVETPLTPEQQTSLEASLFDRWRKCLLKRGLEEVQEGIGLQLQAARVAGVDVDPVTQYLAKWGCAEELSKLHTKNGKNRTPWQLLRDADEGDKYAAALWKEYAREFKGSRQLVWSSGLRALVGLEEERTDEDLAADETEAHTVVRRLLKAEWIAVRAAGDRSTLCDMAEYGLSHVNRYIRECVATWNYRRQEGAKEGQIGRYSPDGTLALKRMYRRFKRPSRSTVFLAVHGNAQLLKVVKWYVFGGYAL